MLNKSTKSLENVDIKINDEENKLKNFILKNKVYFLLFFLSIFLFLSGFWAPFLCFAKIGFYLSIIFLSIKEDYYVMTFAILFNSQTMRIYCVAVFILKMLVVYAIDFKNRKVSLYKVPFFLIFFLILFYSFFGVNSGNSMIDMIIIQGLLLFYFSFAYRKEIDVEGCLKILMFSLLISLIYTGFGLLSDNYLHKLIYIDDLKNKRLQMFTINPNQLSYFLLVMIAFSLYFWDKERGNKYLNIFQIIVCFFVGVLTMSKTFLVVSVILLIYFLIILIKKLKIKSLYVIVPSMILVALICIIFKEKVFMLINRFFAYYKNDSLLNQLTTGRGHIWNLYIESITSSISNMLIGHGLYTGDIFIAGPHSAYLYILFRIGFIGTIMLFLIFYSLFKNLNNLPRFELKKLIPLFIIFLVGLVEDVNFVNFYLLVIFAFLILIVDNKKKEKEKEGK